MRCSCHVCDTYMAQSEGLELGCVCPDCGYRRHFTQRDDPSGVYLSTYYVWYE